MKKKLLGERLLETGLVRQPELAQALQIQQSTGEQLGYVLVRLGYLKEEDLLRLLVEDAGLGYTTLEGIDPDPAVVETFPEAMARAHIALPIRIDGGVVTVAAANPFDPATLEMLDRVYGHRPRLVGAPRDRIRDRIDRVYRATPPESRAHTQYVEGTFRGLGASPSPGFDPHESTREIEVGATAATVVDEIFKRGVGLGATDVHIEPTAEAVEVRYRIDGILRKGRTLPKDIHSAIMTRIKVMAGLNISESRLPQDGRLRVQTGTREVDMRVSTFPTIHGEDIVVRILDRSKVALHLTSLGLSPRDLALFQECLARPLGLVLLTGPTGSGKTTTLYSALSELNTGTRCILTIEDPVEYELAGVRQSQINPRAGLTFASGLRSMLRHDPDVILVGEIRDGDTASIALSAAMTGHLVLSTLHTNSAAAAIPRLLDMGTEPFALASSLQLAVAQRLVRVLCQECKQPTDVPPAVRRRFVLEGVELYRAVGCPKCQNFGYRGRLAIFEFLPTSDLIADAILEQRSAEEIQMLSKRPTLLDACLERVREGLTTLEELLRVVTI